MEDLLNWPAWALECLKACDEWPIRQEQLCKNMGRGVDMHSFYTGKGTDATICEHLNTVLASEGMCGMREGRPSGFKCVSACEIDKDCRRLLCRMNASRRDLYKHVFDDLCDRLKPEHLHVVEEMKPASDADQATRLLASGLTSDYLKSVSAHCELFRRYDSAGRPTAYCHQHFGQCPLFDASASRLKDEPLAQPEQTEPSVKRQKLGSAEAGPLVGAIAGSNCEDFSRLGNRQGLAGPTMRTFHCFTANVKALQPDFMLCENADTCPHELLSEAFGDQYDFMTGVAAPTDFGWPCLRPRRYTFAWKKSDFIFPGSFENYKKIFQRPVSGDGSVFLQASKEERLAHMAAKASKRGNMYGRGCEVPLSASLTATEYRRFEEFEEHVAKKKSPEDDRAWFADIDQNVGFTSVGPYVPVLVKHGKILNMSTKELFLPRELMAVQGEATYVTPGAPSERFPSFFWRAVQEIDTKEASLIRMAGNSFHMVNMGTMTLYCLSVLTPRAAASSFCRKSTQLALDIKGYDDEDSQVVAE